MQGAGRQRKREAREEGPCAASLRAQLGTSLAGGRGTKVGNACVLPGRLPGALSSDLDRRGLSEVGGGGINFCTSGWEDEPDLPKAALLFSTSAKGRKGPGTECKAAQSGSG